MLPQQNMLRLQNMLPQQNMLRLQNMLPPQNIVVQETSMFTDQVSQKSSTPFSAQQSSAFVQLFNNDRNYQQTAQTMFDQFTAFNSRKRKYIPQKIPNVTDMTSQGFTSSQNWQQTLPFSAQQSSAFVQLFNNDRNYQQTAQTMFDQFTAFNSRKRKYIPQKIPNVTDMTSQGFTSSQNWQQTLPFSAQQSSAFVQLFNNDRNYQQTGQTAQTMFDQFTACSSRKRKYIPQKIPNVTGMTSQGFTSSQNWQQSLPFSAQQSSISTQIPHLQSNSYENHPQETYDQTITLNNSENTDGRTTDQFCIDNNEGKELSLSSNNSGRTANKILSELENQHGKKLATVMYMHIQKKKPTDSIIEDYNKNISIENILKTYHIGSETLHAIADWAIKNGLSKLREKKNCIIKEINAGIPKRHTTTDQFCIDNNEGKELSLSSDNSGRTADKILSELKKQHGKKLFTIMRIWKEKLIDFIIEDYNKNIPTQEILTDYRITSRTLQTIVDWAVQNRLSKYKKRSEEQKNCIIKEINAEIPKEHILAKYKMKPHQYDVIKSSAKKKGLLQITTQKSQNVQNSSLNPPEASVSKRCDTIQTLPFLNAKEVEEHLKTIETVISQKPETEDRGNFLDSL